MKVLLLSILISLFALCSCDTHSGEGKEGHDRAIKLLGEHYAKCGDSYFYRDWDRIIQCKEMWMNVQKKQELTDADKLNNVEWRESYVSLILGGACRDYNEMDKKWGTWYGIKGESKDTAYAYLSKKKGEDWKVSFGGSYGGSSSDFHTPITSADIPK